MYNEMEWDYEPNHYECSDCESRRQAEYHTQDHLKGLQIAMMNGQIEDISFHLEEICSANDAEFIYKGDQNE